MIVYSFDRDGTVDVNPMSNDFEAIPLRWVRYLAHATDHEVWAHGNQKLKREAGIPGKAELVNRYKQRWGNPIDHVNERTHKDMEIPLEKSDTETVPDPDLMTAAANWEKGQESFSKQQQLRLLECLFPEADEYICVDNQYLGYVSGWTFYFPHEFADEHDSTLSREVEDIDESELEEQANQISLEERNSNTQIQLASTIGNFLPRSIRERFELTPGKTIPVRLRDK